MIFRFADPWLLCALIVPVLLLVWSPARGGRAFAPTALARVALRPSRGPLLHRLLVALGIAALVVAAARPQYGQVVTERAQAGRDLMLVIDLSGSMQTDDLVDAQNRRLDRLSGVMESARTFIEGRPDDRIGLVFFGDKALTSCPLTYDHETVRQFLARTEQQQRALWARDQGGGLLGGQTNLGLGLGTALKALRDPKSLGRAVILITDGADTRQLRNWVDPLLAARQAARLDVTVYGIGVGNPSGTYTADLGFGRKQLARVPRELLPDLGRLQAITALASGTAFPATDMKALHDVFASIDKLQPTPRTVRQRDDFADRYLLPLLAGLLLVGVALTLEPRLRGVS
jgi:Ca-activated chloride channel family protein